MWIIFSYGNILISSYVAGQFAGYAARRDGAIGIGQAIGRLDKHHRHV